MNDACVVYVAADLPQASFLQLMLAQHDIDSQVLNGALANSTDLFNDWHVAPRVAVSAGDAPRARELMGQFEREMRKRRRAESRASSFPLGSLLVALLHPMLGRYEELLRTRRERRLTEEESDESDEPAVPAWPSCPHCRRSREASCPRCGNDQGPFESAWTPPAPPEEMAFDAHREPVSAGQPVELLVLCPTCGEPFSPRFSPRCQWCGHRFTGR